MVVVVMIFHERQTSARLVWSQRSLVARLTVAPNHFTLIHRLVVEVVAVMIFTSIKQALDVFGAGVLTAAKPPIVD